jgi:hypothetical protein
VNAWVEALEEALAQPPRRPARSSDAKRIKELEREVARKDKALAETTALLVLKKNSQSCGGKRTTTPTTGAANDLGSRR